MDKAIEGEKTNEFSIGIHLNIFSILSLQRQFLLIWNPFYALSLGFYLVPKELINFVMTFGSQNITAHMERGQMHMEEFVGPHLPQIE